MEISMKKFRIIDGSLYIGEWYVGWHTWKPEIVYHECGYEDGNARLSISLFGWHSQFILPWKSKRFPYGDCDEPRWGFAIHGGYLWIYKGGNGNGGNITSHCKNIIAWQLPFTYDSSCRWQVECISDGQRVMVDRKAIEARLTKDWKPIEQVGPVTIEGKEYELYKHYYNYTDAYDGEVIPCTFWIEEIEWRLKWLGWTGLFKKVRRSIAIVFEREVGKDKGSWEGGCMGCGYPMLPGETAHECIRRMEREREL